MKSKIDKELYCQFLLSAQNNFTMTAMAELTGNMAHDKINRWAKEARLTSGILWEYTEGLVDRNSGYLICDDMIIEKDRGKGIELTSKHFSPSDGKYVNGLNLVSILWSDGEKHIPVTFRVHTPQLDGKNKNNRFQDMLKQLHQRQFSPKAVLMDSWYATVDNLKAINSLGWVWITELKKNRIVVPEPHQPINLEKLDIPSQGVIVHLRGYGQVKIIKRVVSKDHLGYLATNDLSFSADDIAKGYAERWKIEEYHRGLKQTTGIEECQARAARIQKNHIFCSILAFTALEAKRIEDGLSWYQSKYQIVKDAIRHYLKSPTISFDFA